MSAIIPLEGSAEHGLLVVNHEYTNPHLMFPGIVKIVEKEGKKVIEVAPLTKDQVDIEMAAHGGTIVEIRKEGGKWQVVKDGKLNRRITANTEMQLTGPAAGNDRLKTNADATGTKVFGTVNNCAGGVTPWGTYVMAEENIHGYFSGELPADHKEAANYKRMGIPEGAYDWASASTTVSTSPRSRTSPIVSAGSSKSTSTIRPRCRRSAPRSAASSMRAPNRSSPPTARWSSISATTSASTTSTSSSPTGTFNADRPRRQRGPARRRYALRREIRRGRLA